MRTVSGWAVPVAKGAMEVSTTSTPIAGAAGQASGVVSGQVTVTTTSAGTFSIRVSVTDRDGLRSNELSGIFRISEFPWVVRRSMPAPRNAFATAVVNGRIYVIGGDDPTAGIIPAPAVDRVDVYDPGADTWSTAPAMPVAAKGHAAVAIGSRIYVTGGYSQTAPGLRTLQVFDTTTGSWSLKAPMPYELREHATAATAGQLWVFGGDGLGFDTANALSYDIATDTWSSRAPMLRAGRGLRAVTVDGKPLVMGGYGSTWVPDAGYYRLVQQYDPGTNTWTARSDMLLPLATFGAAAIDRTVFVAGGGNWERALAEVSAYDVAADRWTARTQMPVRLDAPRAEAVGGKVYVMQGNVTLEYTPANDIL
jgi:N-acetylneuraminic acid mutarotase